MPSYGLALSGGGLTGVIGGLCSANSVLTMFPSLATPDLAVSTVSGGSIGFGIYANANEKLVSHSYLFFPLLFVLRLVL